MPSASMRRLVVELLVRFQQLASLPPTGSTAPDPDGGGCFRFWSAQTQVALRRRVFS